MTHWDDDNMNSVRDNAPMSWDHKSELDPLALALDKYDKALSARNRHMDTWGFMIASEEPITGAERRTNERLYTERSKIMHELQIANAELILAARELLMRSAMHERGK